MKFKRFLATIAMIGILFTTACSEGPVLLDFIGTNESNDPSGVELRLAWDTWMSRPDYEIDTPQYDAYMKRLSDAEEKFKCEIITGEALGDYNLELDIMAGAYCLDIILSGLTGLVNNKNLYPIDVGGIINPFDPKYGGLQALEPAMKNGVCYGVAPTMWPGFEPATGFILAYNRTLFGENNITDLHEYYENKIWTYDTFEKEYVAKTDLTDSNGNIIDVFSTDSTDYYLCLFASNNVKYVKVNDDGSLSADPNAPSLRNALTWGQNLFKNYGYKLDNDVSTHEQTEYRQQQTICTVAYNSQIITGNIAYNDLAKFETGVMPFPCGPDATYGEWGQCLDEVFGFGIPITANSPEAAATIIDYISDPFEEFGGSNGLYDYYINNIFNTELDAEILIASYQYPKPSYIGRGNGEINTVREFLGDIAVNPQRSITEGIASMQAVLTAIIENEIIPNYNTVYGEN